MFLILDLFFSCHDCKNNKEMIGLLREDNKKTNKKLDALMLKLEHQYAAAEAIFPPAATSEAELMELLDHNDLVSFRITANCVKF